MAKQIYGNRYQVTEKVGIGGMAEVFKAIDTTLGRTVAVKVMLPQYAADTTFAARFRQEAQAAANLQSPYIVNIYDWGRDGDSYYIVMEYVRGTDLKTAVGERGRIHPRKVAEIGSQVCAALSVAHGYGIIHRDIKSANIMVQGDGNVKVMDFGIAQAGNASMTKDSSVLGTAHYVSPEQAQGKELDAGSDLYSLGIVMYEAATGQLPFDGPDVVSVAVKQVNEQPVPPRQINPDIDPRLEAIIMKALEKNRETRYRTANEMKNAIDNYLAGRSGGGDTDATTVIGGTNSSNVRTTVIPTIDGTGTMKRAEDDARSKGRNGNAGKKKGGKGKIVLAIVIILALAAAGIGVAMSQGLIGVQKVSVPDVTELTLERATSELEKYDLKVGTVKYETSDTVDQGKVISQDPGKNESVDKDSSVNLVVSEGKNAAQMVSVPNLVTLTPSEAERALQDAGLDSESKSGYSDNYEAGIVCAQDPKANTQVPAGSIVVYTISQGKKTENVTVPSLIGWGEGDAKSELSGLGLKVKVERGSSDSVNVGEVYDMSIAAGTSVEPGSSITIYVREEDPAEPDVPSVVGESEADAKAELKAAGYKVSVDTDIDDDNVGLVISQSPEGGSRASEGTTVTIVVGAEEDE